MPTTSRGENVKPGKAFGAFAPKKGAVSKRRPTSRPSTVALARGVCVHNPLECVFLSNRSSAFFKNVFYAFWISAVVKNGSVIEKNFFGKLRNLKNEKLVKTQHISHNVNFALQSLSRERLFLK